MLYFSVVHQRVTIHMSREGVEGLLADCKHEADAMDWAMTPQMKELLYEATAYEQALGIGGER